MGDLSNNFSRWEFACKCGCGYDDIDIRLVSILQGVRSAIKKSININSGCRCKAHNAATAGSSEISPHLDGMAADISCEDPRYRKRLVDSLIEQCARRIIIYKTFIHVDIDETKPEGLWVF